MTDLLCSDDVKWLVIPRLDVRSMNAQPTWWCTGVPGPMPACGFAHAMSPCFGGPSNLKGVALIWHHFEPRGEYLLDKPNGSYLSFHPHQDRPYINQIETSKKMKFSGQPSVRGDGVLSLILAIDNFARVDVEAILQFINAGRFAGGNIVGHCFILPETDAQRESKRYQMIHEEWDDARAMIRSGFVFVDRTELMREAMQAGAQDPLDAFLVCTQPQSHKGDARKVEQNANTYSDTGGLDATGAEEIAGEKGNAERASPRASWLTPYLAGYYELTPAQKRRMSRMSYVNLDRRSTDMCTYAHAFVEPLVGLGQLLSLREATGIPFWNYSGKKDGVYQITETHCFGSPKPQARRPGVMQNQAKISARNMALS